MGATKLQAGALLGEPARRRGEVRRETRHLAVPAAGQQGDDLGAGLEPERRARLRPIDFEGDRVRERMPDELCGHAPVVVELLLEGQQAQHQVDRSVNAVHPALPPRPHLRAHVLHRRDAGRTQIAAPIPD